MEAKSNPGNTLMQARIDPEVGCNSQNNKKCNPYQNCSDNPIVIALNPKEVKPSPETNKEKKVEVVEASPEEKKKVEVAEASPEVIKKKPEVKTQEVPSTKKIEKNNFEVEVLEASSENIVYNENKENNVSIEVEPTRNTIKVVVCNVGLKSCSKPNLNCLSKSSTVMERYENLYHRNHFRKLMFDKLPSSTMV